MLVGSESALNNIKRNITWLNVNLFQIELVMMQLDAKM